MTAVGEQGTLGGHLMVLASPKDSLKLRLHLHQGALLASPGAEPQTLSMTLQSGGLPCSPGVFPAVHGSSLQLKLHLSWWPSWTDSAKPQLLSVTSCFQYQNHVGDSYKYQALLPT